ncbi:uncharacterized protein F5147DRAFT_767324 [Suillus discolor]|uniref:Uncharacterized protein n=1 Tax=Suillus discolor TaxID=1912936 RepID=A0A9P7FJQ0_9AGAM|nr:uncharacterized protein F5147DRAFT_767324 [Suillus discolor]KAG2119861.1 hypothetical protein F5147DRAFT_767324 [Suillus discolor]
MDMDWELADATPRQILCDSGFMWGLHMALGWTLDHSPTLADLHPSLANLDVALELVLSTYSLISRGPDVLAALDLIFSHALVLSVSHPVLLAPLGV